MPRHFTRLYDDADKRIGSPLDPPFAPFVAQHDRGEGTIGWRYENLHFATAEERDQFITWAVWQPSGISVGELHGMWINAKRDDSKAATEEREFAAAMHAPVYTEATREGATAILNAARELSGWSEDGLRRLLGKLDRDTRLLYQALLATRDQWDNE